MHSTERNKSWYVPLFKLDQNINIAFRTKVGTQD